MGAYIEESRVTAFMPQLPTPDETGYDAVAVTIGQSIEEAEALVNGYLGALYSVPFSSDDVPPIVRHIVTQIAVHLAYNAIYSGESIEGNPYAERYEKWNNNAYDTLKKLAAGEIAIVTEAGAVVAINTDGRSIKGTHSAYQPTFDRDDPSNWKVDADEMDAIKEART
jgi:phage gp36-like protein